LTGLAPLPAQPFDLSARLSGSVDSFASDRFSARLGGSDLTGSFSVRLDPRPTIEAELRSSRFDVADLAAETPASPGEEKPAAPSNPDPRKGGRVIPDTPLRLQALRSLDGKVRLAVDELRLPGVPLRAVALGMELRDGALSVDTAEGTGAHGGRAAGTL